MSIDIIPIAPVPAGGIPFWAFLERVERTPLPASTGGRPGPQEKRLSSVRNTVGAVASLGNVITPLGRGRAWIRQCLLCKCLEECMTAMLEQRRLVEVPMPLCQCYRRWWWVGLGGEGLVVVLVSVLAFVGVLGWLGFVRRAFPLAVAAISLFLYLFQSVTLVLVCLSFPLSKYPWYLVLPKMPGTWYTSIRYSL